MNSNPESATTMDLTKANETSVEKPAIENEG